MININLSHLQGIANGLMHDTVTIRHRMDPAQDPGDRTGDNTIEFEPELTTSPAWFVDAGARSFAAGGQMSVVTDRPTLRLPVGTRCESRDEVLLHGKWWVVIDASADETWPVMLKIGLTRIE